MKTEASDEKNGKFKNNIKNSKKPLTKRLYHDKLIEA